MTVMSTDPLKLLTTEEVAEILGVSTRTVKRALQSGDLQGVLVRGARRFRPADVEAYVELAVGPRPRSRGIPAPAPSLRGRNRR